MTGICEALQDIKIELEYESSGHEAIDDAVSEIERLTAERDDARYMARYLFTMAPIWWRQIPTASGMIEQRPWLLEEE